jgi:uncharacterized protein (UPF0332 family)
VREDVQQHFERAAECFEDGRILLENGRFAASLNRAYYAMFHAATAALLSKDIRRRSHHGVLSAFGEILVKTGRLNQEFFQFFREAFERRQQSDYEPVVDVDRETAQQMLDRALDFVDACRRSIVE